MDKFFTIKIMKRLQYTGIEISALRDIQRSQSVAGFTKSRDAIYITSQ